ncbi:hypothetical protein ABBQ38_013863 [Trebouxia sp. C0009 RCD-2024]
MKVYTKTGDKGTSSLYNGERRHKTDGAFQALGDVDELNSLCGVAREFLIELDSEKSEQLESIQSRLLDVGSAVATPLENSSDGKLQRTLFDVSATSLLETWIDAMDKDLPALTNFILPSGGQAAAFLHLARAVCRRAERSVTLQVSQGACDASVAVYLNRLSDYLFTVARVASRKAQKPETTYQKVK